MLNLLKKILSTPAVAVDVGTANTRIYASEIGTIAEEPSIVNHVNPECNLKNSDAYIRYLNSKFVSTPLRGGVIVDVDTAVTLLKPLFKRVHKGLKQPVTLACAPTDTSESERRLLTEAVRQAGSSHVAVIPEPWAAAIGVGIDPTLPHAQLIIDVGEGVTDLVVIRNEQFIHTSAIRIACFDLHKAIRGAVLVQHRVYPYPEEVERLTHEIDSTLNSHSIEQRGIQIQGIDIVKKRETCIDVNNMDIIVAMEPVIAKILVMIEQSIQSLPERIFEEVSESGICLTGGGSCIKGLDKLIANKTNLNVKVAPDPTHAVINGAVKMLQHWKEQENWWETISWPIVSH